jgi:hypothetical protein
MIDVSDEDIVFERRTSTKRFMLFTSTDRPADCPLPYWGVMLDTCGDAVGILVRLDREAAPNGWTAHELLLVTLEMTRRAGGMTAHGAIGDVERHVTSAVGALETLPGGRDQVPVEFDDSDGGLYALGTEADNGDLWLCPDPGDPSGEGISVEQLLIIVDQMMTDAARVLPACAARKECARHVRLALDAEAARVTSILAAGAMPVRGG